MIEGFKEFEAIRDFLYTRMRGYQARNARIAPTAAATVLGAGADAEMIALLLAIRDELRQTRELLEAAPAPPGVTTPPRHV